MRSCDLLHEKKRTVYIELLRIISAFLVIVNHVDNPMIFYTDISISWYASIILFFISKVAVPIFLMISGCLLLEKRDSIEKYFSRILKFVAVMVLFSTVYYVYFFFDKEMSLAHYIKFFFGSATISYWYLFLYFGILIMLPILQKIAQSLSKQEMQLFLIVSIVIGGSIPILSIFTEIQIENELLEVLFSPYLGMLLMGYYLEKYVSLTKKHLWLATGLFVICIFLQVILTRYLYSIDESAYMRLDIRTSLFVSISAICFYIIIKYIFSSIKIPQTVEKILIYGGSLTFGIYLLGDLSLNIFLPVFRQIYSELDVFVAVVIYAIAINIWSGLCTSVIKKIPLLKSII